MQASTSLSEVNMKGDGQKREQKEKGMGVCNGEEESYKVASDDGAPDGFLFLSFDSWFPSR